MDDGALVTHLLKHRLAGDVATSVKNIRSKIAGLHAADPRCTFGVSLCSLATSDQITDSLLRVAGATLGRDDEPSRIDPEKTLAGVRRHGAMLKNFLKPGNILIATAHPSGLLDHYIGLGMALERSGATLLRPLDGTPIVQTGSRTEPDSGIRFVGGVGCVYRAPGSLGHSHFPHFMEAMLNELSRTGQSVDLVIGDHGMAGAALERGIPTMSIADVNDIPLLLLSERENHALLIIDDNLPSKLFRPVTRAILKIAGTHVLQPANHKHHLTQRGRWLRT